MTLDVLRRTAERDDRAAEDHLRQLMIRYQNADPAAIEELVARMSPVLFRFLAGRDQSRNDTEDLLQECWLRIHRSRHTYRPSEPVLPWIFAIGRYTRLDGYRRRRRAGSHEVLVADPPEPALEPDLAHKVDCRDLVELVGALPESQREVILMLKVAGMSVEEVARATDSTAGAIKQKAHRGYANLRKLLQNGPR
jgi:RNA polymerase sigma-70 factor (ECF subfamily)